MSVLGGPRAAIAAAALLVALVGCTSEQPRPTPSAPASSPAPKPVSSPSNSVAFASVVDGDTIRTSAGTVRLIGIDTPERGECGHDEASAAIGRLLSPGDSVTLELPTGQNDHDSHGRLIRYVATDAGVDVGFMQIEAGNAIARYDSTDGYPAHPREEAYRAAQIAGLAADGVVLTTSCDNPAPAPAVSPDAERWWERYSSCARLKKNEVGDPTGPFDRGDPADAEIYDWFAHRTGNNGDGDNDGLACE